MSYALALANPGSDIDKYLAQVYTIPVLSREEELELTQEFFKTEDVKLAHKLVISHLRFVVHIAKSYAGYGLPLADIIQEGNVGLLKAVKKFDPEKGVRLVSFAVHWIRAEIHEFILKNWRIVKIATTKAQRKLFFNLRSKKQSTGWLTDDEAKKIAKRKNTDTIISILLVTLLRIVFCKFFVWPIITLKFVSLPLIERTFSIAATLIFSPLNSIV